MDIFRYTGSNTNLINAVAVTGYDSVTWIERYRDPGTFVIEGLARNNLLEQLPLGSFISHPDTYEVMVVENHEVKDDPTKDRVVKISGRSLEVLLERRLFGINQDWDVLGNPTEYLYINELTLAAGNTWQQAVDLINAHIKTPLNGSDQMANLEARTYISGDSYESVVRVIKRGDLHKRVVELLAQDDLGIRVVRKHSHTSIFPSSDVYSQFLIHNGNDVSSEVIFSNETGDIESADYLWSIKSLKNTAYVVGSNLELVVEGENPVPTGEDRLYLYVDASDVDETWDDTKTLGETETYAANMRTRGRQELAAYNESILAAVDISKRSSYQYRQDYDIGDIVKVLGDFGVVERMRIVENAEIYDEKGFKSYPTLGRIGV